MTPPRRNVEPTQPNRAQLPMPVVLCLEHLVVEDSRDHSDRVLDFSPMGCQTGFSLILQGEWAYDDVAALVGATVSAPRGTAP